MTHRSKTGRRVLLASLLFSLALPAWAVSPLEDAQTAYFAARFEDALKILDGAIEAETKSGLISADRAKLHLLRSAVRLKQADQKAVAEAEALAAVKLDPELTADPYPPSVQELVEAARQKLPVRVVVQVAATPANADVRIDGRAVSGGILAVVPGTHQVVAKSPGHKTLVKSFEARADMSLPVALTPEGVATTTPAPTPTAIAKATPAPTPTAIAKATPAPTPAPVTTPRPPSTKGGSNLTAYSLLGVAAVSAGVGGHGFVSKGISEKNQTDASPDHKKDYDNEIAQFNLQGMGGAGFAVVSAGIGTWLLLRGGGGRAAWVVPHDDGAVVGISFELRRTDSP